MGWHCNRSKRPDETWRKTPITLDLKGSTVREKAPVLLVPDLALGLKKDSSSSTNHIRRYAEAWEWEAVVQHLSKAAQGQQKEKSTFLIAVQS
jgi:hypothetical protein